MTRRDVILAVFGCEPETLQTYIAVAMVVVLFGLILTLMWTRG